MHAKQRGGSEGEGAGGIAAIEEIEAAEVEQEDVGEMEEDVEAVVTEGARAIAENRVVEQVSGVSQGPVIARGGAAAPRILRPDGVEIGCSEGVDAGIVEDGDAVIVHEAGAEGS